MASVCWLLEARNAALESSFLSYVDNFSWLATNKSSFTRSLQLAQDTCNTLKLPVDWGKSFCWATTPTLRKFLDNGLQPYLPPQVVLRRASDATDLGVHFQFQTRIGRTKEDKRLVEGKHRLDKLRRQPRSIAHKNRLLLAGVWPQTFHGMCSRVLPNAVIDTFRSKAARALCHAGPSQSATLVLSMVVPPISDPEVYLLIQAVTALRRAFQTQPLVAQAVLNRLHATVTDPGPVFGPATALAKMFYKLDWSCDKWGRCTGPGLHSFSVKNSSRKQISRSIQAAWTYSLPHKVSHRNGLAQLGALAVGDTQAVFRKLPAHVQKTGANCIAGGHMSNSAKSLWDPQIEPLCPYCGSRDTKFHWVFNCPFYTDIRPTFAPMLEWVEQHAPHWIHSAVITEHPDDVARLILRSRVYVPAPELSPPILPHYRLMYTDGSCTVTDIPTARHAAWAVVEDRAPQIATGDLLEFYRVRRRLYPCHHVVAQGLVPREQSIGRAEVVALLQVCRMAAAEESTEFHVFVDSTYALHFLRSLPSPGGTSKPPKTDFDLCEWIGVWCRPPNLVAHKVKSHADLLTCNLEQARHFLGNSAADHAAKSARTSDMSLLTDLLDSINTRQLVHRTMLESYLHFQAACARHVTAMAAKPPDVMTAPEPRDTPDDTAAYRRWIALSPGYVMQMTYPELHRSWLVYAPWPPWYTVRVWQWASQLRWQPPNLPPHEALGVAFLELLANFVAVTGQSPPMVGPGGQQADIHVATPEGRMLSLTVKDVVITLSAAIRYLEKTSRTKLMHGTAHKRVRSLETVGCHALPRGFVPRPRLDGQDATFMLLVQLVHGTHPAETLRDCSCQIPADQYGLDSDVHHEWRSLTEHQRLIRRKQLWR